MKTKVTVNNMVNANLEKVWKYWNDPLHIVNWNAAADDWHCPRAENDLRVGGKLKSRMEAKDGSFGFDFEAVYDEVIDQKKVAYTMGDGRQAITTFDENNGQTKLTTVFDAEEQNSIEMQKGGWQAIMDNFKAYVKQK